MNRFFAVVIAVVGLTALAAFFGWQAYQARPEGILLYTPNGPCPAMTHSFTATYLLWLMFAAVMTLLAAAVGFIGSISPRWRSQKRQLRDFASSSLLVLAGLGATSLLHDAFEAGLPLHLNPLCKQSGRS